MQNTLQFQGAFSFGQSKRSKWYILKNQEIPGPGTHSPSHPQKQTKWSVGKEPKRASFIPKHTNAPVGAYEINQNQVFRQTQKYSIPVASRQQQLNLITSDINNHDQSVNFIKERAPIYTMGYTQPFSYENEVPPPNLYHNQKQRTKSDFNKTQKYFTNSSRNSPYQGRQENPGVGDYNLYTLENFSPKIKFPNSNRPPNQVSKHSPGKYYEKIAGNIKKHTLGATFSMRFHDKEPQESPSPDSYNPKYPQRQKKIVMLTSQRSEMVVKDHSTHPNPGAYNLEGQLNKGVGFTQTKRAQVEIHQGPGPGNYQSYSTLNHTLGKMGWKLQKPSNLITPSPLSYKPNTSYTQKRAQNPINLNSNRIDFSKSDTEQIGPGAYELRGDFNNVLGKIGKSERFKFRNTNPGPGSYDISHTIGRLPKYFRNIKRKISEHGQTKIIKYDPKVFFPKKKVNQLPVLDQKQSQTIV